MIKYALYAQIAPLSHELRVRYVVRVSLMQGIACTYARIARMIT